MSTSRSTWKAMERTVADMWTKATGSVCKRNILSGANNRSDDGSPRPGDVVIPKDYDVLIECKYRSSFLHHGLFKGAEADAKKHGLTHTILYTKLKREQGMLVTLDADLFNELLSLPQVKAKLKRVKSNAVRSKRTPQATPGTKGSNQDQ